MSWQMTWKKQHAVGEIRCIKTYNLSLQAWCRLLFGDQPTATKEAES